MASYDISPAMRFLITVAVMAATLMQVLDTTIVNVALTHMQGSLNATSDEISWVLTSYLVSSAIFMPLTGYFTDRMGQKNYLLLSIFGFIIASALCGVAQNLPQIVIFRLLQGVFGAALVPLSQAILTEVYPPEDRGKAMAIWGIGVMLGPILGPSLGGYLTDVANWRWTFYINVPFGIASLLLALAVVPDTIKKARQMDWLGLILISIAIGSTQYFLDRGNQEDWFNSINIKIAVMLSILSLVGFLIYNMKPRRRMIFDLAIFKDRNFTIASLLLGVFGLAMFGAMVIFPIMMENLLNYPVLTTGLAMAPRGISGMVGMILVGKMIKKVDPRYLVAIGMVLSSGGTWIMTQYSTQISLWWILWPQLIQGFGFGLIFVPLSAIAFTTLPKHLKAEAAGLFSLLRTIGSSVGISVVITIFTQETQIVWSQLSGFIQPYHSAVNAYLSPLHLTVNKPVGALILEKTISIQAQMIAVNDALVFVAWSLMVMLPLVFLLKKPVVSNDVPVVAE